MGERVAWTVLVAGAAILVAATLELFLAGTSYGMLVLRIAACAVLAFATGLGIDTLVCMHRDKGSS